MRPRYSPRIRRAPGMTLVAAITSALVLAGVAPAADASIGHPLQTEFAAFPTGPVAVSSMAVGTGRIVRYSQLGPSNGRPVLLVNGSFDGADLVNFFAAYRPLVAQLGLRLVNPERPGNGGTPFDASPGFAELADDWHLLMRNLGYHRYSVLAVSDGGPYADHLATRYPRDVRRLALLSANDTANDKPYCAFATTPDALVPAFQPLIDDPSLYPLLLKPADAVVSSALPGFQEWFESAIPRLADQATHTAIGPSLDSYLQCSGTPISDFSAARFPVHIYHGELEDGDPNTVGVDFDAAVRHAAAYPNVVSFRSYPRSAHFASLRHFGQVLVDLAEVHDNATLLCHGDRSVIVGPLLAAYLTSHGATLDICAWKDTPAADQ